MAEELAPTDFSQLTTEQLRDKVLSRSRRFVGELSERKGLRTSPEQAAPAGDPAISAPTPGEEMKPAGQEAFNPDNAFSPESRLAAARNALSRQRRARELNKQEI